MSEQLSTGKDQKALHAAEEHMNEQPSSIFHENIAQFFAAIVSAIQPLIQQTMSAVQAISDAMWERYLQAGMPYGDSHEGMLHWIEDLSKSNHAQQEAERLSMLLPLED